MTNAATIDYTTKPFTYYDKYGNKIKAGNAIKFSSGKIEKVYLLQDEERLGIDATNPVWIANGRASSCEYGCYPLNCDDLEDCELVSNDELIIQYNRERRAENLKEKIKELQFSINEKYMDISALEEEIEELKTEKDKLNRLLKEVM